MNIKDYYLPEENNPDPDDVNRFNEAMSESLASGRIPVKDLDAFLRKIKDDREIAARSGNAKSNKSRPR